MINLEKYYTKINRNLFNPDSNKEFLNNAVENTQTSNKIIHLSFAYGLEILIMKNLNFEADLNMVKLSLDDAIEINYCLSGEVHIKFKHTHENLYMKSGQLCFNSLNAKVCDIIKKSLHYTGISLFIHKDVMEYFLINPNNRTASQYFSKLLKTTFYENTFILTAGNVIIKTLTEKLMNMNCVNYTPIQELSLRKTIVSLLYETAEYIFNIKISSYNSSQIAIAKSILLDNLVNPPSVERLARLCNLSLSALKSGFKTHYNDTIYGVLRKERLRKAKQLLMEGTSVTNAASEVGYSNSSKFSKAFKAYYGNSPKHFKNNNYIL